MKKKHLVILELRRSRFHQCKNPFLIDNKDINKIVVSNKISFGKKKVLNTLFVTKMIKKVTPLCIILSKT